MSTPMRPRSRKEQFWRQIIRQWDNSGLTVREFCARHELSEPSFYAWKRTIAERHAKALTFVPVRVVHDEIEPDAASGVSGSGLELVLRTGRRLRIGPGFDGPTLQRLLALLEEGQP